MNDYAYNNEEENPWTRPGFIVAAAVVGLVVVFAVVLAVTSLRGGETSGGPKPEAPTVNAPAPAPADPDESAYGLPAGSQKIPATAPKAKWKLVGTIAMPTSPAYGPAKTTRDGVHVGFQHSPTGALFAAAAALSDFSSTSLSNRQAAVRLVPGPSKDKALAKGDDQNNVDRYQIAGFRIIDAKPNNVRVGLALRMTSGSKAGALVTQEYELVWQQGDWLIDIGRLTTYAIPNLAGFIPWGGA